MDKKQNYSRQGSNKVLVSESRKSDINQSKPWPKSSKRRENSNNNNIFKNDQRINKHNNNNNNNKFRSSVDKRPKPRTFINNNENSSITLAESATGSGLAINVVAIENGDDSEHENGLIHEGSTVELNSVCSSGSKKQNLNHLLNFHYVPYESLSGGNGLNVFGKQNYKGITKRQKYNKEQYLQANFQFVVKRAAEQFIDVSNPDTLIDWTVIEQINIQTTEEPQCPICLYPPIAAKLTRCGHVYCWPCILHYLSLSDKTWRKCPICYEAIHIKDLKSTSIIQQKNFKTSDSITFQLMRRKRGTIFAEKCPENENEIFNVPCLRNNITRNLFSKFLIVDLAEIVSFLDKEYNELQNENDIDCPEALFVQKALDLLKERKTIIAQEHGMNSDQLNDYIASLFNEKLKANDGQTLAASISEEIKSVNPDIEENNSSIDEYTIEIAQENVDYKEFETNENEGTTELGAIKKERFYYFYQSVDGQNIFLHPLNVKMLQSMYGTLNKGPKIIESKILQKEFYSMDENLRKKFTCLGHLPLTCQFEVAEVNFQPPIVSDYVMKIFKDDILSRQKARNRRDRDEKKREKQINEFNDRQMGKLIARSANIDIGSVQQFPTCGFEEPLSSNSYEESTMREYGAYLDDSSSLSLVNASQNKNTISFATILSSPKKESWPTLANNNSMQTQAAWNQISSTNTSVREVQNSESEFAETSLGLRNTNLSDVLAEAFEMKKKQNNSENANPNGNKKGKKGKKTLLFSTGMSFSGN